MKRITLRSPLVFNHRGKATAFAPRVEYEVSDDVAAHPFIAAHLLKCEDITHPKALNLVAEKPEVEESEEVKVEVVEEVAEKPKKTASKKRKSKKEENE